MNSSMLIQVALKLKDEMAGRAARAMGDVERGAKGAARASDELGGKATRAMRETERGATAAARASREMGRAAETAGRARLGGLVGQINQVRQQTQAAVSGLKAMASQAASAGKAVAGGLAGAGSAVAAGGYVAGRALAKPIDFEQRMAGMASTAFNGRDVNGLKAGAQELTETVNFAVRQGGGTRDEAANALDKMLASGAVEAGSAKRLLPIIQKYATASQTDSGEIADIIIRGLQSGYFQEDQVGEALDKALVAGQKGGFELKNMAKWLPQFLASAKGMRGMEGYERILASAQASVTTAGSKDAAGNNLVNLLNKINSQDTAKDFAKLGVDLPGTLAKAREKGKLPLDAFVELIDKKVVGQDKAFQALKAKAAKAQGGDKKDVLNDMVDILKASSVGQVIQDREALMALVAEMTQPDYVKSVLGAMKGAGGAGQVAFENMAGTTAFAQQQAVNQGDIASSKMHQDVKPYLDAALKGVADLAEKFPTVAGAAMEASTAIGTMTAAAAAFGGLRLLTGGGKALAAGEGAAGVLGGAAKAGRWAGRAGGAMALGMTALEVYQTEADPSLSRADKMKAHAQTAGQTAGGVGGMMAGAQVGAMLGTAVMPGVGTAVGGAVGGIAGGLAGSAIGEWLVSQVQNLLFKDERQMTVHSHLNLDGREIAEVVNSFNAFEAARE